MVPERPIWSENTNLIDCPTALLDKSPESGQMRILQGAENGEVRKESSPTRWFELREGAARRTAGSTSTPPFVFPANMGQRSTPISNARNPRCWERPGFPVDYANTRLLGERYTRHPSHSSSVQHWSTCTRSCHAIGDEHHVPKSDCMKRFTNDLRNNVPRAYTISVRSSGLQAFRGEVFLC